MVCQVLLSTCLRRLISRASTFKRCVINSYLWFACCKRGNYCYHAQSQGRANQAYLQRLWCRGKISKNIDVLTADELRKYLADNGVTPLAKPLDDDGSNTNWQKLAERTSYSQNHNLSYSGAGNNAEYGASVNYFKMMVF
jgi:hypothetical protein